MTLSRMEKYHNNKNKKFKKSIATALMGTVLVAPIALSSASVNADTVQAGSQPTQTEWVANSVSTVRAEMQAQGLNLNNVNGKYVVRQGDTLSAISIAAHESMQQIANDNHITNLNMIYVGQVLYLRHTNESTMIANAHVEGTTGNGTVVAHAPRTSAQVQANALVNQGVMPNVGSSVVMNNNNTRPASSATSVAHHDAAKADNHQAPAKNNHIASSKASSTVAKNDSSKKAESHIAGNTDKHSASSTASSNKSSATNSSKASSAVSSSTVDKGSQASSSVKTPAATSSSANSQTSATSSSSSNTGNAGQASSSSSASTTAPSQSSSSSQATPDYDKDVVNANGTVNYQAAINQKGPWDNKSSQPGTAQNSFYDSAAEETWEKDHPGVKMTDQGYSDGSDSRVPVYSGQDHLESQARPELSQSQLNQANQTMQKNVNASQTFGNGIQWVSSDYKGEVVGTRYVGGDNPVNTPYQNYADHTGEIAANNVQEAWGTKQGGMGVTGYQTTPDGAKYVSSTMKNVPVSQQTPGQGSDGCNQTITTLTFYK